MEFAQEKIRNRSEIIICQSGARERYSDGKLHCENGPAVERLDGTKEWYLNGRRHRENGPAIERRNGFKAWYRDGRRHREDGPAIERVDGTKEWYHRGLLHRADGPAIVSANGTTVWCFEGHAIETTDPLSFGMEAMRNGISTVRKWLARKSWGMYPASDWFRRSAALKKEPTLQLRFGPTLAGIGPSNAP